LDTELFTYAKALFEERLMARGPAFATRLSRFEHLLRKYQKVCGLLETRSGMVAGEIEKPKE
jgi:hypothetical protein